MALRLSDILKQARRKSFVGRESELALFQELIVQEDPSCYLLYLYGPGGQGKTTLLRRFMDQCEDSGMPSLYLDGRELNPHPTSLQEALLLATQTAHWDEVQEKIESLGKKVILFMDTYEKLSPVDDWVCKEFLPQLPPNVFTVISGRNAPSLTWKTDAGWKALMKTLPLKSLEPSEAIEFLERKNNIPKEEFNSILAFTHGHPLALSVVAEIYEQHPGKKFNPEASPDAIRTLLDIFLQQVPGPAHRTALEICALAQSTTESLLEGTLEFADSGQFFHWLRQLSFIEQGKYGLYPHDLVREAIIADLRWRNPEWYAAIHEKVRHYYLSKFRELSGDGQRRVLFDLIYLHRLNPMVKPFFDWQESGSTWMDLAGKTDLPILESMVEKFEGKEQAGHFLFWAGRPETTTWVWRDLEKNPVAFLQKIDGHLLERGFQSPDPAVARVLQYSERQFHLRGGEQLALFRFWMGAETYQAVSSHQSSIFLAIVQYYFTPGLAVSMICCAHPEFWKQIFDYAFISHLPELDFSTGDKSWGWYMHDWRKRPTMTWLDLLGRREIDATLHNAPPEEEQKTGWVALNETEFLDALESALKSLHDRDELSVNPLLFSRVVLKDLGAKSGPAEKIERLQTLIRRELEAMEQSPANNKYHRVLYRTYLNPVGSQERTADFLKMSFSTYRRYLRAGVEKLSEGLWKQEIEG